MRKSVPLPQHAHLDTVTASLSDDQSDLADGLAAKFKDKRTWKARAAEADKMFQAFASENDGARLPACIPVLTTMLEARGDAQIVCSNMAGLYLVSRHEDWRQAARDWFMAEDEAHMVRWLQAHPGVAALLSVFLVAHVRTK